jgi:hypothetical protein
VPRPRVNLVRHHGVFAPHARLRSAVVPSTKAPADSDEEPTRKVRSGRYLAWAELLARVFELDVTVCPKCGTRGMQVVATITQADVIHDILACIGEPTAPPALAPARPPQLDGVAAQTDEHPTTTRWAVALHGTVCSERRIPTLSASPRGPSALCLPSSLGDFPVYDNWELGISELGVSTDLH